MIKRIFFIAIIFSGLCTNVHSAETIRVLTWEGYVLPEEVKAVNKILKKKGYPYKVEVISPFATGAEQMFRLIREDKCDIMFLTIFFIKMQGQKTSKLLQPINLNSPRLTNYKYLLPGLKDIPMGLDKNLRPLGGETVLCKNFQHLFTVDNNTLLFQDFHGGIMYPAQINYSKRIVGSDGIASHDVFLNLFIKKLYFALFSDALQCLNCCI